MEDHCRRDRGCERSDALGRVVVDVDPTAGPLAVACDAVADVGTEAGRGSLEIEVCLAVEECVVSARSGAHEHCSRALAAAGVTLVVVAVVAVAGVSAISAWEVEAVLAVDPLAQETQHLTYPASLDFVCRCREPVEVA